MKSVSIDIRYNIFPSDLSGWCVGVGDVHHKRHNQTKTSPIRIVCTMLILENAFYLHFRFSSPLNCLLLFQMQWKLSLLVTLHSRHIKHICSAHVIDIFGMSVAAQFFPHDGTHPCPKTSFFPRVSLPIHTQCTKRFLWCPLVWKDKAMDLKCIMDELSPSYFFNLLKHLMKKKNTLAPVEIDLWVQRRPNKSFF